MDSARFLIKRVFRLKGRDLFIAGDIVSGKIFPGMLADLQSPAICRNVKIDGIEFLLHQRDGIHVEEVALALAGMSEEDTGLFYHLPIEINIIQS